VADRTRRWFADSTLSYALGVIALFEYARAHSVRYVYGPLDTESMLDGGLVVSGDETDLNAAARVLEDIPGLVEYVAGEEEPLARLAIRGR
jgi:hypothetical protein